VEEVVLGKENLNRHTISTLYEEFPAEEGFE
jgi:hypothetical protein